MSLANFKCGVGHFASDDTSQPSWYGYRVNNNPANPPLVDGGFAQQGFGGAGVPTTGSFNTIGPNLGQAQAYAFGFAFRGVGAAAWIADAPFVFFDPRNNNKSWFLYNWLLYTYDPNDGMNGNHIYAFPMLDGINMMDANGTGFPAAYRHNTSINSNFSLPFQPTQNDQVERPQIGPAYNGQVGNLGQTIGVEGQAYTGWRDRVWRWLGPTPRNGFGSPVGHLAGVAESPSVYYSHFSSRYYIAYSRNAWNSPAYQVVYRMSPPQTPSGTNFSEHSTGIALSVGNDASIQEHVLLRSRYNEFDAHGNPVDPARVSFGNGEFFEAFNRAYVICHRGSKEAGGVYRRRVYVKEVWINQSTGLLGIIREPGDPEINPLQPRRENIKHLWIPH